MDGHDHGGLHEEFAFVRGGDSCDGLKNEERGGEEKEEGGVDAAQRK